MQQPFLFIGTQHAADAYPFVTAPTTGGITDGYAVEYDLPEDAADELLEADPSIEGAEIEVELAEDDEDDVCEIADCPVCAQAHAELAGDIAALFEELFEALEEMPMSREIAVAITRLEEAEMWAGKAVDAEA